MILNINQPYLVLGIGTDIGKTFIVEKILQKYNATKAIKPIATGFNPSDLSSDTMRILKVLKDNKYDFEKEIKHFKIDLPSQKYYQLVSPFVFEKPTSPNLVGDIDYDQLLDFCFSQINFAQQNHLNLIIESAGGVMTPINNHKTFLHLAQDLKIKIILVSSNYLGAISHTLTAIETITKNNLAIDHIIINDELSSNQNFFKNYPDLTFQEISQTLKNFCDIKISQLKKIF
jgi:dethiobiotin synthetase